MASAKNIIVFIPNKPFFGHLILQMPFFHQLKELNPDSQIIVFSAIKQGNFFLENKLCDKVIYFKKGITEISLIRKIAKEKPAQIYNLKPYSTLLQLVISFFRSSRRIGFSTGMNKLAYSTSINYNTSIYKACLYLSMLQNDFTKESLSYFKNMKDENVIQHTDLITMMPGGGEGEHKKWGIENFISLAQLILKESPSCRIVFILGPMEKEEKQKILLSSVNPYCIILENPTIEAINTLSKKSKCVIANDCGPSHIAQMTDCNYIGVWGWEKQHPMQRIAEWSFPSERSIQIVAEYQQSIKTISPKRVFQHIKGLI